MKSCGILSRSDVHVMDLQLHTLYAGRAALQWQAWNLSDRLNQHLFDLTCNAGFPPVSSYYHWLNIIIIHLCFLFLLLVIGPAFRRKCVDSRASPFSSAGHIARPHWASLTAVGQARCRATPDFSWNHIPNWSKLLVPQVKWILKYTMLTGSLIHLFFVYLCICRVLNHLESGQCGR